MAKEYYAKYRSGEVSGIRACESCGSKRSLNMTPFLDAIAVECDYCGSGKVLWENKAESLSPTQIESIGEIIEAALSQPDKELAMYTAKAEINKMK